MKNTTYCVIWILIHGACNCNNSFNFSNFSKFQDELEKDLLKLHFHSLNQTLKMVILKITIKDNKCAFTFWMCRPLGANQPHSFTLGDWDNLSLDLME